MGLNVYLFISLGQEQVNRPGPEVRYLLPLPYANMIFYQLAHFLIRENMQALIASLIAPRQRLRHHATT